MSESALVESHPWINFRVDLRRVPHETWVLLGECSSKIEHISGVPLKPAVQRALNQIFLAKGAHATTAIEGNTLSEEQVRELLDGNLHLPKSMEYLAVEVDNIVSGYNHVIERIAAGAPVEVCADDLQRLNRFVLQGLECDEGVIPGHFREHTVVVGDYRSPPASFNHILIDRLCAWMNDPVWEDVIGAPFVLPILKAIFCHLYIAWIHPFGDGNGRTARLLEFDILTRGGVPTASAHLLSDHYNRTRAAYYRALTAARSDPLRFVVYAVQGFVDGLREQIASVRQHQMQVAWQDYVYQEFAREPVTPAADRRREVVLALSYQPSPVPKSKVPEVTPRLASAYAGTTPKTLTRDLNALESMGLVKRVREGYAARQEVMLAFLPLVHPDAEAKRGIRAVAH